MFLSLAVAGWDGYRKLVRRHVELGEFLRQELQKSGWRVVNSTKLPIACFVDAATAEGSSASYIRSIAQHVVASGDAWIISKRLNADVVALRACITNYRTDAADVQALVRALDKARAAVRVIR